MKYERNRAIQIPLRVNETELHQIESRMHEVGMINREAYLRKMALEGYVLRLDIPELTEMISLLRRSSNNINQIARRLNESGRIYEMDLKEIQNNQEQLWKQSEEILNRITDLA